MTSCLGEELLDHAGVRRGDAGVRRGPPRCAYRPGRAANRKVERAEVEVEHLVDGGAGVDEQIPAGDAEVEVTRGDVGGDVARAQVEELDVVVGVEAGEILVVGALAVSGLAQHLGGGGGETALVRYGDT